MTVSALDGISGCLLLSSFFSFPYWPSLCSLHSLEKVQLRSQMEGEASPEVGHAWGGPLLLL